MQPNITVKAAAAFGLRWTPRKRAAHYHNVELNRMRGGGTPDARTRFSWPGAADDLP